METAAKVEDLDDTDAIIGGVVGGVIIVVLVIAIVIVYWKRYI